VKADPPGIERFTVALL